MNYFVSKSLEILYVLLFFLKISILISELYHQESRKTRFDEIHQRILVEKRLR